MADTLTKNFKFVKPAFNKKPWQQSFYDSMDAIDAILARYILVSNFVGVWNQATAYTAGQRVVDTVGGAIYTCNVNHTSTAVNTFAQDRIANPTFWTIFTFSVQFRGTWVTNTDYSTGDFVVFGQRLAVANATHHSSASFITDQANGLWNVLIDGTAVVALPTGTAANADQTIRYDGVSLQYQLTANHKVSSAGVTTLPAGAVGAPSLTFNGQGGFFSPGANLVALTVGGVEIWRQKNDGTATVAFPDAFRQGLGFPAAAAAIAGQSLGWDSTAGTTIVSQGPLTGYKNKIINGDMRIDQRNVSTTITPVTTAYAADRWQIQQSTGSKLSFRQRLVSLTDAFPNALQLTVANSFVPGVGDVFTARQGIEGFNIHELAWGTASAKPVTISFWAQCSVAGVYNIALQNGAGTRGYGVLITIAAPSVAQFFTVTIPGDTSAGAWSTDSTAGIWLVFDMGSGSTFTSAPGVWQAFAVYSATGATKFVSQVNGSTFFITGVQLEIGSVATPFERRPFATELALCQRYYQKSYRLADKPGTVVPSVTGSFIGQSDSGSVVRMSVGLPVRMRTSPSAVGYSYATGASNAMRNDSAGGDVGLAGMLPQEAQVGAICNFGAAAQQAQLCYTLDAEL